MSYLDFLIKLNDQVSPGMVKAANTTDAMSARMQRSMDMMAMHTMKTNNAIGSLNAATRQVTVSIDQMADKIGKSMRDAIQETRKFDRELNGLGKRGAGGAGGSFGGILGGAGLGTLAGAAGVGIALKKGLDLATSSVDSAMSMGKTQKSFEVLTGSVENGKKLVGDINKMVKETVLGPELFQNAQTLLAFGVSLDKIMPSLKMLGDVSMGDQEKLNALTLAFAQVNAAGRLTGQDLLQFVNAGFNPLQEISKATGISMAQLRKEMEAGGISSDMVTKAFAMATSEGGKFNNMLAEIAKTPAGMRAQLEGQWEGFKVKLGDAFMPLWTTGMQGLNKLLELAQQVLPYIVDGVSWIVTGLTEMTNPTGQWASYLEVAKMAGESIIAGLSHIWKFILNIGTQTFAWIQKSNLLKDLFWLIGKIIEGVWFFTSKIVDAISWVYDNIFFPILNAIEWVYNKVKSILGLAAEKPIEIKASIDNKPVSPVFTPTTPSAPVDPVTMGAMPTGFKMDKAPSLSADTTGKAGAINSGGQRSIVINVTKMVESINLNTVNMKESAEEVRKIITEQFLRVLQSANGVAYN